MFDVLSPSTLRAPEQDEAQTPLGRLLVDRGLLTEEQLEYALAEQGRIGLPIGQVLIGLSYVTAATIAQALATQEGGLVKTEFGLATGFGTPGLVSLPPVSPPPAATAPSWTQPADVVPAAEAPQPAAPEQVAPSLPLPDMGLVAANTRITELEMELASVASTSAEQLSAAHARIAELEQALASASTASADELVTARTRIAELESDADALRGTATERIQSLEAERDAQTAELRQTQAQLASATENLRAAYERLHQFEIAQALQQHQQARTASPFAWQA